MAYSKSEQFDPDLAQLADFASALSHPARLEILRALAKSNSCICGDIVQMLPLAQSTVSQHLKALKEAGLVRGDIEGPRTCYCLNCETFEKMIGLISKFVACIRGDKSDTKCC